MALTLPLTPNQSTKREQQLPGLAIVLSFGIPFGQTKMMPFQHHLCISLEQEILNVIGI